jgi:heterodisulfide reductase subunit B
VLAIDEGVSLAMAGSKLDHVRARQADAMVLLCPFCNIMYEANQKKIEKVQGKEYKLPVLFYPQLLGLAMGMEPDELGLKMNRVKATELLKKINRRAA